MLLPALTLQNYRHCPLSTDHTNINASRSYLLTSNQRFTMPTSKALILLFPKFNTLDVNGPLEVLRKSGQSDIIDVEIASETCITESVEGCKIEVRTR